MILLWCHSVAFVSKLFDYKKLISLFKTISRFKGKKFLW